MFSEQFPTGKQVPNGGYNGMQLDAQIQIIMTDHWCSGSWQPLSDNDTGETFFGTMPADGPPQDVPERPLKGVSHEF